MPKYGSNPSLLLSMLALIRGDYDTAAAIAEDVRQRCDAYPNAGNHQTACYTLARTALLRGQYEAAQHYIQQAYATVQAAGDGWFRAYCLLEMGNISSALKNYAGAKEHYQAAYDLRQEFNDPEGMAVALNHLGEATLQQKDFAGAGQLFEQSRAIYRENGDRGGLATALNGLGRSAAALDDLETARRQFEEALQIAAEMQYMPLMLAILAGIADLLDQTGSAELRLELLTLLAQHPASSPQLREQARQNLPADPDSTSPVEDLPPLMTGLQSLLAAPLPAAGPAAPSTAAASPDQPSPLVEPLTEREVEVLHLMAEGLTNPEIAERLIIATGTVKYYTGQIYGKLGVRNRVEAVARGRELKLI